MCLMFENKINPMIWTQKEKYTETKLSKNKTM